MRAGSTFRWSTIEVGQVLRHLVPQQRQHHIVGGHDDVLDRLLLDDSFQRFDDFLDVLNVIVLDVALESRLGPAAL